MSNASNDPTTSHQELDDAPEPPPRGVKAMGAFRWALVGLAATAAIWTWAPYVRGEHAQATAASEAAKTRYRCPMHHQIVSDEPGECPICHMTLVPFVLEETPPTAVSAPALAAVPPPAQPAPRPGGSHAGPATSPMPTPDASGDAPPPGTLPPGTRSITLTFDRVQSIGVRTALAEERQSGGTLRVTATVAAPEQGAAEVHVRSPGFVERIGVRETGVEVSAGQELLGVYSPDVLQAENELLAAKSFGESGARSVDAARQRLELLGMSPRAIDDVVASGKAERVVSIASPARGYVAKKNVVLGSYVTPESTLYEIVDLSRVYIVADVFQRDISSIHVGTEGRFAPAAQPEKALAAKIDLVYPQLNAEARTTRVRMQLQNGKRELLPGQYGNVEFALKASKVVVVPRDALVDTGRATYVFIDEGGGRYTPRVVAVGRELDGDFEVLAGVSAGERVVSSATFLVDSESRLQASIAQGGAR